MKNLMIALRFALGALFGLCAADGILQVRGLGLLTPFWENTAAALFFLLAGAALFRAYKDGDTKALKRLRLWAGAVLLGSLLLLLVMWWLMVAGASHALLTAALYALAVVSAPVASCTVLFWPIFAWALLLVASHSLCRARGNSKKRGA